MKCLFSPVLSPVELGDLDIVLKEKFTKMKILSSFIVFFFLFEHEDIWRYQVSPFPLYVCVCVCVCVCVQENINILQGGIDFFLGKTITVP